MTPVDVVTVWTPRQADEHWRDDYLPLLELQVRTARRFSHRHITVTDAKAVYGSHHTLRSEIVGELPLMQAMIAGVLEYLRAFDGERRHAVLVDVDCLVARDLSGAFHGDEFGLGLLNRVDDVAPINNGAMYVHADAFEKAREFFEDALKRCGTHWGADQEAISAAAAPVPSGNWIEDRDGLRVAFLPMRTHGVVPKAVGAKHYSDPYIVHFKGDTKPWAQVYADRHILPAEVA